MTRPPPDSHAALAGRLRVGRLAGFDRAVAEAAGLGAAGDHLLATTLAEVRGWRAVLIAAALGDTHGEAGPSALRSVLGASGPGSRDLRCAAILALTKRVGAVATPDMVECLGARDGAVREYALFCLAGAGDDRGWDDVLAWLAKSLRVTPPASALPPSALIAVAYLARHSRPGSARLITVVQLLRRCWRQGSHENRVWLTKLWPAVAPDGPDADQVPLPDDRWLQSWANDALLKPVALSR